MSERSISIQDAVDALLLIRDSIVTDDNIGTVVGIVEKMEILLTSMYNWFQDDAPSQEELLDIAEEEGVVEETEQILPLLEESMTDDDSEDSRGFGEWWKRVFSGDTKEIFSLQGCMEAITFIRDHLELSDDILQDLSALFDALRTVELFKQQEEDSDEQSRSLLMNQAGVEDLYKSLY